MIRFHYFPHIFLFFSPLVNEIGDELTNNRLVQVLQGRLRKDFPVALADPARHARCFGMGAFLKQNDLQQVLNEIRCKDCLSETHRVKGGYNNVYVGIGRQAQRLWNREFRITITLAKKQQQQQQQQQPAQQQPGGKSSSSSTKSSRGNATRSSSSTSSSLQMAATANGVVENELVTEVAPRLSEDRQKRFFDALVASRTMLSSMYAGAVSVLTNSVLEEIAINGLSIH